MTCHASPIVPIAASLQDQGQSRRRANVQYPQHCLRQRILQAAQVQGGTGAETCMDCHTCSEMDIWSSGPRMATLPAMVAGSVSKMTLHGHMLSQRNASLHQPLAPPPAAVEHMRPSIEKLIAGCSIPGKGGYVHYF